MNAAEPSASRAGWFATSAVERRAFRKLWGDIDTDICIIGAGIAGLTAARDLARRGWSVTVLEAGAVGGHPSLPPIGAVAAGFSARIDRLVARLGVERAKQLWALSAEGAARVRTTIAETGMAGVRPVDGELIVQHIDDDDAAEAYAARLRDVGADAQAWPKARVRAVLRTTRHFQAVHRRDAFHIHPLNYLLGLAAAAEQAGVRIFENAPVSAIDTGGVRKHLRTGAGQVRAAHIILTTTDLGGQAHPLLARSTITLARHLAVTAPLGERAAEAIGFTGLVTQFGRSAVQYRLQGDRLLWASPLVVSQSAPWGFAWRTGRRIGKLYPPLRGADISHCWTSTATYAVHRMPQIGQLAPNVWHAGAFGEGGLAGATMAGELIARAIDQGDERWRLFLPFGLSWSGGALGCALASLGLRGARIAGWIGQRLRRGDSSPLPSPAAGPDLAPAPADAPDLAAAAASPMVPAQTAPKRRARRAAPKRTLQAGLPDAVETPGAGAPRAKRRRAKASARRAALRVPPRGVPPAASELGAAQPGRPDRNPEAGEPGTL